MKKVYTRAEIVEILNNRNDAVDRAMVRIFQLQTASEQSSGSTRECNGVGFNSTDARRGSYYARWVMTGKPLSGRFLRHARKMAIRYSGQLTRIANGELVLPNF